MSGRWDDPMPLPVNEALTPCPKRHPLFDLCVGPIDHEGPHAVWWRSQWITWTDAQPEEHLVSGEEVDRIGSAWAKDLGIQ